MDKQFKVTIRYIDQLDIAQEILRNIEEDYGYGGDIEEESS